MENLANLWTYMEFNKSSNHRMLERSAAEAVAYKSAAVLAPPAGVLGRLLSKNLA